MAQYATNPPSVKAKMLGWHQPHTPEPPYRPDSVRPTCSEPTRNNRGCDMYAHCQLRKQDGSFMKDPTAGAGPCHVVVEDHRGVNFGEGRRFSKWCFSAVRLYRRAGMEKAGFSFAEDRVFETASGELQQLAPYEDQGPYPWPKEGQVADPEVAMKRQAFLAKQERETRKAQKQAAKAEESDHGDQDGSLPGHG